MRTTVSDSDASVSSMEDVFVDGENVTFDLDVDFYMGERERGKENRQNTGFPAIRGAGFFNVLVIMAYLQGF